MTLVVDASAVVELLLNTISVDGRTALAHAELVAPDLIFAEVLAAIVRLRRRGQLGADDAEAVIESFLALPIEGLTTREHLRVALALTDRVSAYDACYVAVASAEASSLLTADRKLSRAHDLPVEVVVV